MSLNSAIYTGVVRHRRYRPRAHAFSYGLYMLALDLDELPVLAASSHDFALERFAPLSFCRRDYLGDEGTPLKQAVLEEVARLGGESLGLERVLMLGQVRCFGIYFSPVNLFFCYQHGEARYLLAEVRNTPWNERHCYLVDLRQPEATAKAFHVSPFMGMAMNYHWRISPPAKRALVHIENRDPGLLFDATLALRRRPFEAHVLRTALRQWPVMTLTVMRGIYWQALKLLLKRIPYHSHP
ncbi:DUF1365 domain-containing protein [Oceanimonas pelagia]|uniref:DUF1365 domain-containing protein n=1 Tax=Oceanimonas pelagia TaxID=3028314 RepID=A0AA50KLV6_9GAMM|nr:DUF1365 domain-containing protein [Oceanimonas pelagia]WMC09365.1 DUF1365 domain-containing protein [Oceanimonas pelagia]